ncbi:AraC family transcriptional regulator [Sphingobacterium pedocola]|uniref:HTH araC/xylS-type domain-containing protein n=1 Tax=Sphingobacterium pedocola TaxID=2082722 RepID=A0ABR9TAK2_9SPHI|nr:helix-turn-helix domain-containing protein [Sphingobacterium pedocola]MBE8722082.1 hypothetical protein [Sphingobacterium pedocola]
MVIWLLYAAILVVALLGIHLSSLVTSPSRLNQVIRAFLILVTIHIIHAALFRDVFIGLKYVDRGAPFGLLYGPLLFFAYRTAHNDMLSLKTIIWHAFPFIIGLLAYSCFLAFYQFRMAYDRPYFAILYGLMALSWLIYPIVVVLSDNRRHTDSKWIYRYAIVILLILAAFMLPLVITGTVKGHRATSSTSGFVIFLSMFLGVCLAYFYQLYQLTGTRRATSKANIQIEKPKPLLENDVTAITVDTTKFQKYYGRIETYLRHERYLNTEFKISGMLRELRLPKPVVVAFFADEYGATVKQAINSLRVKKACELLEMEFLENSMEELAMKCGFNSRASFYRNFNQEKACTPLEYRDNHLFKKRRNA